MAVEPAGDRQYVAEVHLAEERGEGAGSLQGGLTGSQRGAAMVEHLDDGVVGVEHDFAARPVGV